jgi:hypothetical protein
VGRSHDLRMCCSKARCAKLLIAYGQAFGVSDERLAASGLHA